MEDNFSSPTFIEQLKKKEPEAVEALVKKYNTILFRGALAQLKDPVVSEELLQDTWSAFFDAIDRFEGKSHIRTFLFGILYNKIREKRRDQARFVDLETPDPILETQFSENGDWRDSPISPEAFAKAGQDKIALEDCLEGLGENQRQAFYLKEVLGESTEDICKILDVSVTNLGVLVYRAKNRLRKCLEAKAVGPGI